MGKSSAPTPPPAPTSQEISAANTESAFALAKLQRAMQFGEPVTKQGYRAINVDRPAGDATPIYSTTSVNTGEYPSIIRFNAGGGIQSLKLDSQGNFTGEVVGGPSWTGERAKGINYKDSNKLRLAGIPAYGRGGSPNFELGGMTPGTKEVKQLTGWNMPDGTVSEVGYVDDAGNEVSRDIALEADFTGMGDVDLARKQWEFEQETSPQRTQFLLDQMKQFGPEFTEQARELVKRSDPTGFAARELLGKLAQEYRPAEVPGGPEFQETGDVELMERVGDLSPLERLEQSEIPVFGEAEITGQGRGALEQALIDRAQSGRTAELMGEEASRLARMRAPEGNLFGGGAVLEESRAIRQAEDAGQRQALSDLLGLLSSGQSATDTENRFAQQNLANKLMGIEQRTGQTLAERADEYSAAGQRNQAADTDFARQQAAMGQRNQMRQQAFANAMQRTATQQQMQQQQMANLQSFSGLAPVSGQFGGLAGAQQAGAANFNPVQYQPSSAAGLLAGQQNLAGGIFGKQAGMWGTQAQIANQGSGFGQIAGTVAGAALGGPMGGMLGNKMFGTGSTPTQIWDAFPGV